MRTMKEPYLTIVLSLVTTMIGFIAGVAFALAKFL